MCEQCLANAKTIRNNVIPGYALMQAKGASQHWPQGWYGLVRSNDPLVTFELLAADPHANLTDAQINAHPDHPDEKAFSDAFMALHERMRLTPEAGYHLVSACIAAGYDLEEDGMLAGWLMHRMANLAAGPVEPAVTGSSQR